MVVVKKGLVIVFIWILTQSIYAFSEEDIIPPVATPPQNGATFPQNSESTSPIAIPEEVPSIPQNEYATENQPETQSKPSNLSTVDKIKLLINQLTSPKPSNPDSKNGGSLNASESEPQTSENAIEARRAEEKTQIDRLLNVNRKQLEKILQQATQPEPYQISCVPQALTTSVRDNYNAYIVAVASSKYAAAVTSEATIVALNAAIPNAMTITKKTMMNSVVGKSFLSALGVLPAFIPSVIGQSTLPLAPGLLSLAGTTIPVIAGGTKDYAHDRLAQKETLYYDGFFRDQNAQLSRMQKTHKQSSRRKKNNPDAFIIYKKLPLYSNLLISKQSNNGKPLIHVANSTGQAWSYSLTCDNRMELSREHKKALEIIERLQADVSIPTDNPEEKEAD
jgi:hypothetical protein